MKCPRFLWERWNERDHFPWWALWLFPTLHYCHDFDGLLIDKYMGEYEFCNCLDTKEQA